MFSMDHDANRRLASPMGIEPKPDAPSGLVDPDFEQAGAGDIAVPVAPRVRLAHVAAIAMSSLGARRA
jgi:hypothetical protein